MLMHDIRRQNYQVFKGIDEARKKSALENSLKYIDTLATSAGINISEWPVLEIFHNQTTGHVHTDKVKINQAFFVWAKQHQPSRSRLTAQRKMALVALHNKFKTVRADRLKFALEGEIRTANAHLNNYETIMRKACRIRQDILALDKNAADTFSIDLSQVIDDGWYKILDISSTTICLETAEIVLNHVNAAQKVNIKVPMGTFLVKYDLSCGSLKVLTNTNNIVLDSEDGNGYRSGYYHPHVTQTGQICYGNLRDAANHAIANMNIRDVFELTRAIINSYNDDNPYVHLYLFDECLKRKLKRKEDEQKEAQKEESEDEQ